MIWRMRMKRRRKKRRREQLRQLEKVRGKIRLLREKVNRRLEIPRIDNMEVISTTTEVVIEVEVAIGAGVDIIEVDTIEVDMAMITKMVSIQTKDSQSKEETEEEGLVKEIEGEELLVKAVKQKEEEEVTKDTEEVLAKE